MSNVDRQTMRRARVRVHDGGLGAEATPAWPAEFEELLGFFLGVEATEDEPAGAACTITFFVQDGRLKGFVNPKDTGYKGFVTFQDPGNVWAELLEMVDGDRIDWQVDKPTARQGRRR